jgi:hypothetical protein
MKPEQIRDTVESHAKWLRGEDGGERADFAGEDLAVADLIGVNLSRADLSGADLTRVRLGGSVLTEANLDGANLDGADLMGASLNCATLVRANLRRAYLHGTGLYGANLHGANLHGAVLTEADLGEANLSEADLTESNLSEADFTKAKLNWRSHDMIAELLRRAAGNKVSRRMLAGLVLVSRDWCWEEFLNLSHPEREWALGVLHRHAIYPDDLPEEVMVACERLAEVSP